MSDKLSIKVVVAGRSYPLSVRPDEQEKVIKAAEEINKSIKTLQDNYAVKDMQDLLAMTALQLAIKTAPKVEKVETPADYSAIEKALEQLSSEFNEQ
ncbi:MAG TPA: cell division protein ZapA [Taishania sp.]|nr:cell division protein ZapA [Taishania sp.]HNS41502.1 cell division protein ZapA [Taishania sp.]